MTETVRITIECEDDVGLNVRRTDGAAATVPDATRVINGGQPAAALFEAMGMRAPPVEEAHAPVAGIPSGGIDAGGPPQWLLEAVQGGAPSSETANAASGGAGPG